MTKKPILPLGTRALIFSKFYYGVLSKQLEGIEADRYFSILYFLSQNGKCTQQFICNHMATDKAAMVKVMDYLVELSYVTRVSNPNDRRELIVSLTPKGKKRTAEIVDCFEELDTKLMNSVKKQDGEIFERVLNSFTNNLKEEPFTDIFFNIKKTRNRKR